MEVKHLRFWAMLFTVFTNCNAFRCYSCHGAGCESISNDTEIVADCNYPMKCIAMKKTEGSTTIFIRDCLPNPNTDAANITTSCLKSGLGQTCYTTCTTDLCNNQTSLISEQTYSTEATAILDTSTTSGGNPVFMEYSSTFLPILYIFSLLTFISALNTLG